MRLGDHNLTSILSTSSAPIHGHNVLTEVAALPSPAALHLSEFLVTGVLALIFLAVRCRRTRSATDSLEETASSPAADGEEENIIRRLGRLLRFSNLMLITG